MRIIFDDCLGYIRDGTRPFVGLKTKPASDDAIEQLGSRLPNRHEAVELLSPRYVAAWGTDEKVSFCTVQIVWRNEDLSDVGLFGVNPDTFPDEVTKRAIAAGITEHYRGDEFSALSTSGWFEPETGYETGPLRPISFTILPTSESEDRSLVDIGIIVMGGPPQTSHRHSAPVGSARF